MATGMFVFDLGSLPAGADLSDKVFYCAKINASSEIVLCDAQGEACQGVIQNDPLQGEAVTLRCEGVTQVVASGAIAAGAALTVGTAGKVEAAAAGDFILGYAMESASADGDIITMLLQRSGVAA